MKKNVTEATNILTEPLEEIMGDRFGRYSKYIIQDRALPDVRDGLKPVQRRILYAMYVDGNVHEKAYRKSAKTVGLVIGNYHPHGDSSVYEAMVRLSQQWKMRIPLVDMHGNNGSIDNDPAAAMRYTEARLSAPSALLLQDIDQDTVLFAPNFDDSLNEPTVLPAQFPNLLINGTTGISAGYATNIPSHNPHEIIDAVIYRIQHPDSELNELMKIVKGPDFPTGGIVQGHKGIKEAFKTGKGRIIIRSKTQIVATKTVNQIVITEIPYEVVKVVLVKQIDEIKLGKDAQGILDVRDESDRNGLRIVIDVKKEQDANVILNYLLKKTSLQVSYTYNMVAIVDKRPVQLGLIGLVDAYVAFRREVVLRRSQFQLTKIETRCHILDGLVKAVSIMDEIIALIRQSKDKGDAKQRLMDTYAFSDLQAEAIVTLRLYRLTSTDIVELREEYAQLMVQMEKLKAIIGDAGILDQLLIRELRTVRESIESPRLTEIQDDVEEIVIDKQMMIVNERVMVTVSRDGYLKRVSLRSYNASPADLTGIKEADELIGAAEADLLDNILLLTSGGDYLYLPIYEIDDAKWKDIGSHLNTLASINGDKIIAAYIVKNLDTAAWLITVSREGMLKRTPLPDLVTQRFNRTYSLMGLRKGDELVDAAVAYCGDELVMASRGGRVVRYGLDQLPVTTLKAKGVKGMNLVKGDVIAALQTIYPEALNLAVINTQGGMKRIKLNDIVNGKRPLRGDMLFKQRKSDPYAIRCLAVTQTYDEINLITDKLIKVVSKDISLLGMDGTFSSQIALPADWYRLRGLPEIRVIDRPETLEAKPDKEIKEHDDFEFIAFDV